MNTAFATIAISALLLQAPPAAPKAAAPPRQPGPSTVVPPPFVPSAGAQPTRTGSAPGAMPPPYIAGAHQFLVQPGQTWQHLLADVQPGDEIIFPAGFHVPQVIEGLQGTRDKPIFLRSRDRIPAAVACETDGWVFRRPKHVVVENIMFLNPSGAAVILDGGAPTDGQPWSAEFTLRSCTVEGARREATQDGVRVKGCSDVRIDRMRVNGWNDAAVDVEDSRRILVRGLMMVPDDKLPQSAGIRVAGSGGEISITGCSFNKVIRTGVVVGTPCPGGDATLMRPIEHMRIDRCIFENIGTAVELRNARDLVLSRATIVNPTKAIYSVAADAGTIEQVLVEHCLAFWFPGMLARFSPHPDRVLPTAVTLGDNLWYSRELPEAWEVLGAPLGYQAIPQTTSIDPGIDSTTLRPHHGDAVRYGAYSVTVPTGTRPALDPVQTPEPPAAPSTP